MNIIRTLLPVSVLAIALGSSASATIITVSSGTYSGAFATNFPSLGSPGSENVTVQQFDAFDANAAIQTNCPVTDLCSALTLTAINFTLNGIVDGTLTFNNTNSTSVNVTPTCSPTCQLATATADLGLTDQNGALVGSSFPSFNLTTSFSIAANSSVTKTGTGTDSETGSINALTGVVSNSLNQPESNSPLTSTQISNTYVFNTIGFNGGTDVVTLSGMLTGFETQPGQIPNNVNISNNTETLDSASSASIQYVYSYSDTVIPTGTPEPTTMLLFGSALVGLGLLRNRSRQQ
jgi:hypothetical protein